MKPLPSLGELRDIVYQHYPRGSLYAAPGYDESPEYQRLLAARRARMEDPRWPQLLEALEQRFPEADIEDWNIPSHDAGFRCRVEVRRPGAPPQLRPFGAVGLISQLAPIYMVYVVYADLPEFPPELRGQLLFEPTGPAAPYARALAEEIERIFACSPLPLAWAETPMPDVCVPEVGDGQARLIHCLFTSDPWWLETY